MPILQVRPCWWSPEAHLRRTVTTGYAGTEQRGAISCQQGIGRRPELTLNIRDDSGQDCCEVVRYFPYHLPFTVYDQSKYCSGSTVLEMWCEEAPYLTSAQRFCILGPGRGIGRFAAAMPSRLSLRASWHVGGAELTCHQGMSVEIFEPPNWNELSALWKPATGSGSIILAHRRIELSMLF